MATFCWEAESLPLDFVVPVSHSVLDVATEIHFVFQTFPRLFNPGLSFAVGGEKWHCWEGAAAVEGGCRARVTSVTMLCLHGEEENVLFGFGRTILVTRFSNIKSI